MRQLPQWHISRTPCSEVGETQAGVRSRRAVGTAEGAVTVVPKGWYTQNYQGARCTEHYSQELYHSCVRSHMPNSTFSPSTASSNPLVINPLHQHPTCHSHMETNFTSSTVPYNLSNFFSSDIKQNSSRPTQEIAATTRSELIATCNN